MQNLIKEDFFTLNSYINNINLIMKLSYYSKFEIIIKSLNNYRLLDAQPAFEKHFGNIFPTIKRTSDSITFIINENDDIIGFNKKDISKQLINRLNELKEQYKNSDSINDQSFYQLLEGFDEKWFHPNNIIEGSNQNFKLKYWGIPPKDLKKSEYNEKTKKPRAGVIIDPISPAPNDEGPIEQELDDGKPEEETTQEEADDKPERDDIHTIDEEEADDEPEWDNIHTIDEEETTQEEADDEPEWNDIHTIDEEETTQEETEVEDSEKEIINLENHHSLIIEVANGDAIFDLTYDDGTTEQIETHELRKSLPKGQPVKIKISKQGYTTRYMHFSALKDKESFINLSEDPYANGNNKKKSGCLSIIGKTLMYAAIIVFIYIKFIDDTFNERKAKNATTENQCENKAHGLWVYGECIDPKKKFNYAPIQVKSVLLDYNYYNYGWKYKTDVASGTKDAFIWNETYEDIEASINLNAKDFSKFDINENSVKLKFKIYNGDEMLECEDIYEDDKCYGTPNGYTFEYTFKYLKLNSYQTQKYHLPSFNYNLQIPGSFTIDIFYKNKKIYSYFINS